MFCPKHPAVEMAMVCGEPACSPCFVELMEAEKAAAPKPRPAKPAPPVKHAGLFKPMDRAAFEALSDRVRAVAGMPPLFSK